MSKIEIGTVVVIDDSHSVVLERFYKKEGHSGCRGVVSGIADDLSFYIVKITQCKGPHAHQEGKKRLFPRSALEVVEREVSSYLTDESYFHDD